MAIYDEVVEYVNSTFQNKNIKHFERTVYWFEQLKGQPLTEMEKVAAYAHDIERGFRGSETVVMGESYTDEKFLYYHQNEGARIIGEFLASKGVSEQDISIVKHLITRHEQGGDQDQDNLMNADSLSFFETNAEKFATEKVKNEGYEKIKEKLDWMFNRITSDKAKEIARPLYDKWSREAYKYK